MAAAIVEPGANGAVGYTGSSTPVPPRSAAGFVHSTLMPLAVVRPKIASAGTGWSKAEKATTHPTWPRGAARRDVLEVAADVLAAPDEDVAAEQEGGDEQAAGRRLGVDLLGDDLAQHEGALRVADEDDAAAVVVLAQVRAPRLDDVGVGAGLTKLRCGGPAGRWVSACNVYWRYIGAKTRHSRE